MILNDLLRSNLRLAAVFAKRAYFTRRRPGVQIPSRPPSLSSAVTPCPLGRGGHSGHPWTPLFRSVQRAFKTPQTEQFPVGSEHRLHDLEAAA